MPAIDIRPMRSDEWNRVAELIHDSTNAWYQNSGKPAIFSAGPESTLVFCEVYEAIDPGCCLVAEDNERRKLVGSCFYHPRSTHVSLGIMNAAPGAFGRGVAGLLLRKIIEECDRQAKPLRLVSSAMNLDSYSLYNRNGLTPRIVFQDMYLPAGVELPPPPNGTERVRPARPTDTAAMAALEFELAGIERESDYRYFLENHSGIWHASVFEGSSGRIDGFLVSVHHPGSHMLGPGMMRDESQAAALIWAELSRHRGRSPVFLVPAYAQALLRLLYAWGARNCELHFGQGLGEYPLPRGVWMPSFMPETG